MPRRLVESEKIPFAKVKREVARLIKRRTVESIKTYIAQHTPTLWGDQQPRDFVEKMVYLTLFKDLKAIGYTRLLSTIETKLKIAPRTVQHNVKVIRKTLHNWAAENLRLGDLEEWTKNARQVVLGSRIKNACLWQDSIDIPLQRGQDRGRRSAYWSFKLNRPARRFMIIRDGKKQIRKIWGGYSPKVYDGIWLEMHKEWLEANLQGAAVLADCHFEWGRKNLNGVVYHTPYQRRARQADGPDGADVAVLSRDQEIYNEQVRTARARIENTFAQLTSTWQCLREPWAESEEQLDYVVLIAAACYNCALN